MAVTQAQVAQLYVALFNRAPEGAGFNAWVNAGATKTVAQMANEMLASPATGPYFESLGIDIVSDRGYVENIYKNILGKDYSQDPDGINAWVKHLQLGNSRGDTLVKLFEVATSTEARAADPVAAQTFVNKTAISEYAAQKIADIPTDENGAYDFSLFQRIIAQTNNTNLDEQKAAIDALVAPTVHNLSAGANDVSGSEKADVFNGAVSATVGQTTFKATDKLDGKGGNDTLNLDLYTNFHGMTNAVGEVKNIENLNLTNHTNGMLTFNTRNIHNMESITIDGSTNQQGVNIINPENKVKLNLKNIKLGANSLNLYYNTDVLASGNDDQEVTVDGVDTGTGKINITTVNNDKVEAVTVKAVGQASKLNKFVSDHLTGSNDGSIKTITVKGSADLTITGTSSLQTFDASAYTGNKLVANLSANNVVQSIKGSGQDDVFNITGTPGTIIPINGGAGRDVVNMLNTISGNKHVEMSGVEELNINPTNYPGAHTQLDFSRARDIDTLGIGGAAVTPNKNVTVLNSNIKTVNINSEGETIVGLSDASLENYNIKKGTTTTLKTGAAQKLNVNVDAQTSQYFGLEGGVGLKEVNLTINKSAAPFSSAIGNHYNNTTFETLNIVNKTANAFENHRVVTKLADGSTVTNTTLKTLNVETKGDYELKYNVGGLSSINLKGTGEATKAQIVTQPGQSLGMPTDGRYPLQGTQDINLTAEGLKTLEVAAISGGKIITTRNVSLTSTTDKENATVTYGQIGDSATAKANDVSINATGQKTLTTGNIYANGDVNLTTKFTQEGSSAIYAKETVSTDTSVTGGIKARNFSLNHSANSGITDGIIRTNGNLDVTGNLNVNASGYKTLKMSVTPVTAFSPITDWEKINVGGDAKFNTTATVAGASAEIGYQPSPISIDETHVAVKAKNLKINANAASGITDSTLKLANYESLGGNIDITANNQKTVDIGWLRGFNTNDNSKKSDVNINLNTNVADARVKIGTEDSTYKYGIGSLLPSSPTDHIEVKNVNFKAYGQKTLDVKGINATENINIEIKGSGANSTATFLEPIFTENGNVNIKTSGLKALKLGSVESRKKDVTIDTGADNYLQTADIRYIRGENVTLNLSNVTAPINNYSNPIEIKAGEGITINGYNAWPTWVEIDVGWGNGNPNLKTFIANLTNAYGGISSYIHHYIENIVVKGGMTNPEHLISAGVDTELRVSGLRIPSLKTIDLSEYDNASGITRITTIDGAIFNDNVTTVKGSKTKDEIEIGSKNLKLVDTGAGDDKVKFTITQTKDITVNLGAGNDEIKFDGATELTANKKFQISGGEGNDTFILGLAKTDADASKYVTITDASRGDKISLGSTGAARLQKISLNVDSRADLKTAINDALSSLSSTDADTIYAVYYGNDTYLVRDDNGNKTLDNNDNLVKLAGTSNFDLLNANSVTQGGVNYIQITNA